MSTLSRLGCLLTLCLSTIPLATATAEDLVASTWPQWRGPHRTGFSTGPDWPDSLRPELLKSTWRKELGPGYSGPIVATDRIFVTETVDKKTEIIRALDRRTGSELWKQSWSGALSVPFFAKENGDWIRSTPAWDGEQLYVGGMRDLLVSLNGKDGQIRWKTDLVQHFKSSVPAFGLVCSPLVLNEFIYVQGGAGFVKLHKQTGEVQWRVLNDGGGMWGSAFSSPFLTTFDGQPQILVQTRSKLVGVDPDRGTILWSQEIPAFRGMNILTPTPFQDGVLTSSYGGKTSLFQVKREQGTWKVSLRWENKAQGYMSSPIVMGNYAYLHLRNQRFTCINLTDGKEMWRTTPFGKYWSLVARGNKLLALDESGELFLIRANPEKFEILDQRKVTEHSAWAHLAVSDQQLFIRDLQGITAWQWPSR